MKEQWIIEHEWEIAKMLITSCDYKMLLFKLPQYGLYLQSLSPIPVAYKKRPIGIQIHFAQAKTPHIAVIRTQKTDNVTTFIQNEKQFRAYRIFKHAMYLPTLEKQHIIGLVCDTTKNMLHLLPEKTFRIKSNDVELRNLFYEKAVEINEQDNLGCSFDYDEYDYVLEIRKYKRFLDGLFHRWAVITIVYGADMPNSWSIENSEFNSKSEERKMKHCPKCNSVDTEPDEMFQGLTKCKSCGIVTDDEKFMVFT